ANPIQKRKVCALTPAFMAAADESVILAYWKLKDNIQDNGFFRSIAPRILCVLLYFSYGKAVRRKPDFELEVRTCLQELRVLENSSCTSLDRAADTFARILKAAGKAVAKEENRRPVEQILYHVGRWIYLADAYDDLKEDFYRKRYNPLTARFSLAKPELNDEEQKALEMTMRHSLNLADSAYQLADFGRWSDIIGNILYLGLPMAGSNILKGLRIKQKKSRARF
ncbi:MAG: DUF5685 family protein, partial [Oscillospiraceae bacterium]|nr:DUF5685 family protein [Oscillospiraceae bacterium]